MYYRMFALRSLLFATIFINIHLDTRSGFRDIWQIQPTSEQSIDRCIDTYHSFAYEGLTRPRLTENIPLSLEAVTTLPAGNLPGYTMRLGTISLIRDTVEGQEIWVIGSAQPTTPNSPSTSHVSVYFANEQRWESYLGTIDGLPIFVVDVFNTPDGTIWGVAGWDWDASDEFAGEMRQVPVLARFNGETDTFHFATGAPLMTPFRTNLHDLWFSSPEVILDQSGRIWVFNTDYGIYHFDPTTENSSLDAVLPILDAYSADLALAPDGSIYIGSYTNNTYPYSLQNNPIFRFVPEDPDPFVRRIELPSELWPIHSGLRFDTEGNLWVGAIGFRDPDGAWHSILSDLTVFFDYMEGNLFWGTPRLDYVTSDGRLWFTRFFDTGRWLDGTAWYDPEINGGCQFTTLAISSFYEDSRQILWINDLSNLYALDLLP